MLPLFLGFKVDSDCSQALSQADSQLLASFIHDDYLVDVLHEGSRFLGKWIPHESSLADLELLEANLCSLLQKILPSFPFQCKDLVVIPCKSKS